MSERIYLLTEIAYPGLPGQGTPHVPVSIGEKGSFFTKLKIQGTPGHGSAPYGTDNAVEKVVAALNGIIETPMPARITNEWVSFVRSLGLDGQTTDALTDIERLDSATGVDEIRALISEAPLVQGSGDGIEYFNVAVSGPTVTFHHRFFYGADGIHSGLEAGCIGGINDSVTVVDGKITVYDWGVYDWRAGTGTVCP